MKSRLLTGIVICIVFMGCREPNSDYQANADGNRLSPMSNNSAIQDSRTPTEEQIKIKERGVYAMLLTKLVYGEGKAGLRPEDIILINKSTVSSEVKFDFAGEVGVNSEAVADFINKNVNVSEFPKGLDVYFTYELVDINVATLEPKPRKSNLVLSFSRIGLSKDLEEGLVFVEIKNYVTKEVQPIYYKVKRANGGLNFTEVRPKN